MLNMLPTPSLADLLYAFFRAPSFDGELIAGPWRRRGDAVHWLSRSAWSLRAISEWHRSFHPDRPVRFWVPDFFCSQSLAGLRGEATALQFYPIDENLRPNWKECRILAKSGPPDVFLVVHYHGLPADVKGATEFCGQHRAVL